MPRDKKSKALFMRYCFLNLETETFDFDWKLTSGKVTFTNKNVKLLFIYTIVKKIIAKYFCIFITAVVFSLRRAFKIINFKALNHCTFKSDDLTNSHTFRSDGLTICEVSS